MGRVPNRLWKCRPTYTCAHLLVRTKCATTSHAYKHVHYLDHIRRFLFSSVRSQQTIYNYIETTNIALAN